MRIIIAEDDNVSRLILESELHRLGHKVLTARDGEGAWTLYQASGADVIISDGMMPGVDGFELCRRVRGAPSSSYPYFIFLTNLADETFVRRGMEAGADDYLPKPLDPAGLTARLVVAGRISELHRRLAAQQEEMVALNEALYLQARSDPLTGLANRLCLNEDLPGFARRVDGGETFCAIMCDIDYFKLYNDRYGHAGGDDVLRKVAATLKATLRHGDHAYRFGGEEFLVVAPVRRDAEAEAIAERFRAAIERLAEPHDASALGIVTLSVGSAVSRAAPAFKVAAWLAAADAALYRSKELGRNRMTFRPAA
jgi:two-component system chemotaxis response regulator CheY